MLQMIVPDQIVDADDHVNVIFSDEYPEYMCCDVEFRTGKQVFSAIVDHVIKYHRGPFEFKRQLLDDKSGLVIYKLETFPITTDALQTHIRTYQRHPTFHNGQLSFPEQSDDISSPCAKKTLSGCRKAVRDGWV